MTTLSKLITAAALVVAISMTGACASEDDCNGNDCSNIERQAPGDSADDRASTVPCEDMCANVDECGFMPEDECINACAADAFTADERDCLATACGDAIGICLDTGRHGDGGHTGQDGGRGDRE